jgi:hypothetical protein
LIRIAYVYTINLSRWLKNPVGLFISQRVQKKLSTKVPPVSRSEIHQCFMNRTGSFLEDTRANNRTTPPTKWFIAETNLKRTLKVVFIRTRSEIIIKTAYEPNPEELRIYRKYA